MTVLAMGIIIGYMLGIISKPMYELIRDWRISRRKFTCDACKMTKRAKEGFAPLALDLEYGTELVPLNLRLCRSCAPNA